MAADLILENDKVKIVDGQLEVEEGINAKRGLFCRDEDSGETWLQASAEPGGRASLFLGAFLEKDEYSNAEIRVRAADGDSALSTKGLRTRNVRTRELNATEANLSKVVLSAMTYGEPGGFGSSLTILDHNNNETITLDGETGEIRLDALGGSVADRILALEQHVDGGGASGPNGRIDAPLQFANGSEPLAFIFESPSSHTRPLLAHSPAYPNWGVAYNDPEDKLTVQRNGEAVLTVDIQDKKVGIGTDSPMHELHVNGSAAGTQGFKQLSDARCKEDVETLDGALDVVRQLRGVSFRWRDDACAGLHVADGPQVGFLAQEVEAVLPEAVREDDAGYHTVAYGTVVPVLTEAVKEQQQTIERQAEQIEAQSRQINALRDELGACLDAIRELRREAGSVPTPSVETRSGQAMPDA